VTSKETIKSKKSNETTAKSGSSANLINDTKQELAKVVWPSRQQLLSESVAVILMVTVVATLIYLFDQVFGWLAGKVF
jgi:preprotein translocase subunit SecE